MGHETPAVNICRGNLSTVDHAASSIIAYTEARPSVRKETERGRSDAVQPAGLWGAIICSSFAMTTSRNAISAFLSHQDGHARP